jgi:signal transduction histidine kinase
VTRDLTRPAVDEDAGVVEPPQHRREPDAADPTAVIVGPDPEPRWYSERAEFWRRSMRGWDVAFYLMWALGVGALLVAEPRGGSRTVALVTFGVLLVAYTVIGRRAAATADLRLAFAYLAILAACVTVIVANVPMGSLLLFIAYSQVWYLTPSRRVGIALTIALSVAIFGTLAVVNDVDTLTEVVELVTEAGIAVAFAILLGLWVTTVVEQSEERADLLARLEAAQAAAAASHHAAGVLAERERMAREIHDTLAQGFTSIVMLAQTAAADLRRRRSDDAATRLALIERTARENLAEARALVAASAPVGLAESTLAEALERLAARFGEETGVRVRLVADDDALAGLTRDREVILLRAAQEALTNVRRHAQATRVELVLAADGPDTVRLEVVDDGRGMPQAAVEGFGLRGMRDRVATGGGSLAVTSGDGTGTSVQVTMPTGREPGHDGHQPGSEEEVR